MIQITPQMKILLAVEPVDFRKGIDGLVGLCRQRLESDPITGAMFVFSSRSRKSIKILCYDGQGYFLCQKRLSQGRFLWWPSLGHPLGLKRALIEQLRAKRPFFAKLPIQAQHVVVMLPDRLPIRSGLGSCFFIRNRVWNWLCRG